METNTGLAAVPDNVSGENTSTDKKENDPVRLLTATSVIGDHVHNPANEHMGTIMDIMLNVRTGSIEYYIVEFGGFLGIDEKYFAIPFRLLHVDPAEKLFRFNESLEKLKEAPGFDKEHWPGTNEHYNYVRDSWTFWGP